jgi:hypothetical protein
MKSHDLFRWRNGLCSGWRLRNLLGLRVCALERLWGSPSLLFIWYKILSTDFFFFLVSMGGVRPSPLGTSAAVGLLYQPSMMMIMEQLVEWDWQGKPKYSEKTCLSATSSTTNLTWPDLGSNPGRRDGKPATNRLSYGTAFHRVRGWTEWASDWLLRSSSVFWECLEP